jgi:hypothetical protein
VTIIGFPIVLHWVHIQSHFFAAGFRMDGIGRTDGMNGGAAVVGMELKSGTIVLIGSQSTAPGLE